ncbi:MAG: hypothetical protein H0U21_16750, partial [Acidimicrobiia bacterium]|nr:hypothetical protein [Acidimicrobiia bacterium]
MTTRPTTKETPAMLLTHRPIRSRGRRWRTAVALVTVAGFVGAACGDDSDDPTADETDAPVATQAGGSAPGTPAGTPAGTTGGSGGGGAGLTIMIGSSGDAETNAV